MKRSAAGRTLSPGAAHSEGGTREACSLPPRLGAALVRLLPGQALRGRPSRAARLRARLFLSVLARVVGEVLHGDMGVVPPAHGGEQFPDCHLEHAGLLGGPPLGRSYIVVGLTCAIALKFAQVN